MKEVDEWLGTPEWELAGRIHAVLCRRGHQMDECWGLESPYDLNQPRLTHIQRDYLGRAQALLVEFDSGQIDTILSIFRISRPVAEELYL